jgi:hypothetical protein
MDADDNADDANDDDADDEPPARSTGVGTDDSNEPPAESAGVGPHNNGNETNDNNNQAALDQEMEAKYGPRNEWYDIRQRKARDYSHLFVTEGKEEEEEEDMSFAEGEEAEEEEDTPLATPQMSVKKGIKVFGRDGVAAVKKEMLQLHDRKVMVPKHAKELTPKQKQEALAYLMFLKWKRCGKIKGCGCADGRKQHAYTAHKDAASPTMATKMIFLMAVIYALEGHDVAIIDVPGAFMQADMDELVHVWFTGKIMLDMLLEIDPEMYSPCVVQEGKERVMYMELLKVFYGTVRAT